jgi:hypothetical protein
MLKRQACSQQTIDQTCPKKMPPRCSPKQNKQCPVTHAAGDASWEHPTPDAKPIPINIKKLLPPALVGSTQPKNEALLINAKFSNCGLVPAPKPPLGYTWSYLACKIGYFGSYLAIDRNLWWPGAGPYVSPLCSSVESSMRPARRPYAMHVTTCLTAKNPPSRILDIGNRGQHTGKKDQKNTFAQALEETLSRLRRVVLLYPCLRLDSRGGELHH